MNVKYDKEEGNETEKPNTAGTINFKVPKEMSGMIEEIRTARAAEFESTSNTSIAKAAIKALHEKVVASA